MLRGAAVARPRLDRAGADLAGDGVVAGGVDPIDRVAVVPEQGAALARVGDGDRPVVVVAMALPGDPAAETRTVAAGAADADRFFEVELVAGSAGTEVFGEAAQGEEFSLREAHPRRRQHLERRRRRAGFDCRD